MSPIADVHQYQPSRFRKIVRHASPKNHFHGAGRRQPVESEGSAAGEGKKGAEQKSRSATRTELPPRRTEIR